MDPRIMGISDTNLKLTPVHILHPPHPTTSHPLLHFMVTRTKQYKAALINFKSCKHKAYNIRLDSQKFKLSRKLGDTSSS